MMANSIRRLVRPDEALRQLFECLILSFNYVEAHQKFQIISDYPEKKSTSDRAFATFIFGGVTDFVRMSGDLTKFSRFTFAYQAVDDEAPIVIQSVRPRKNGDSSAIEFWCGPNFGGLKFAYGDVSAFVRDAQAQQVGSSFIYRDVASGEEFAFSDPFAGISMGTNGHISLD